MQANLAPLKPEIATASLDATCTSVEATVTIPMTRRSTPDSVALNPVSGKRHSKEAIRARPVWTAYSIAHVKFMASQTSQQTTPTETVGFLNRPAS